MNTFNDVLDKIIELLPLYQPLQRYAQLHFDKQFTVTRRFRPRSGVHSSDLPLIMVTRPKVTKTYKTTARDADHTVSLYVGFNQPAVEGDAEDTLSKAQEHIIAIEELIDDFLLANITLGGTVEWIHPTDSENDEGYYHPDYFIRMDCAARHRRSAT